MLLLIQTAASHGLDFSSVLPVPAGSAKTLSSSFEEVVRLKHRLPLLIIKKIIAQLRICDTKI